MKLTTKDLSICLIIMLLFSLYYNKENNINTAKQANVSKYINRILPGGKNSIVILHNSGKVDTQGDPIEFIDKIVIKEATKVLEQENYTLIYMALPCIGDIECYSKYFEIAELILDIKPSAVIFNSPSSGLNTDTLGQIFNEANIPLYTYQTENALNYKLYVGPNNENIGQNLAKGLKPYIKPKDKIIYVETVRLLNGDLLDNGYRRINAARELLNNYGAVEYKTIFTEWSKSKTYEEVLKLLLTEPNISYIVTPSAETAEGAILAVEQLKLQTKVKVVSMDFTIKTLELINEERLEGTVSQQLKQQGRQLAHSIIQDKNISQNFKGKQKILFSSEYITKDNLSEFQKEGIFEW